LGNGRWRSTGRIGCRGPFHEHIRPRTSVVGRDRVREISMSVEDALRFTISAGVARKDG
jgi:hypothetical protein